MNTNSQTINFHQTLHLLVIIERQKRLDTLSNLILYIIKQYQRNDEHHSLSCMRAMCDHQLSQLDRKRRYPLDLHKIHPWQTPIEKRLCSFKNFSRFISNILSVELMLQVDCNTWRHTLHLFYRDIAKYF